MHYLFLETNQENHEVQIQDPYFEKLLNGTVEKTDEKQNNQNQKQSISQNFRILEHEYKTYLMKDAYISMESQEKFMKSHIIYIISIPNDFDLKQMISQIIFQYSEHLKYIRIINQIDYALGCSLQSQSIVIGFKDQFNAEKFYHQYNCYQLSQKEELLYIVFLKEIRFFCNKTINFEKILKQSNNELLILLPTCPLCIERLDVSRSGFNFQPVDKLYIYDMKDRWQNVLKNCLACSSTVNNNIKCDQCDQKEDLWVCLLCGIVGCGRYKFAHAVQHEVNTGHSFSMEIKTGRIWDYLCDTFVHRIMKSDDEIMIVNLPDSLKNEQINLNQSSQINLKSQDQIDSAIWEYCYVISYQMEDQRNFFQQKLEKQDNYYKNLIEQNEKSIKDFNQKKIELDNIEEQLKKEHEHQKKKIKQLLEKNQNFKQQIEDQMIFNNSIQENLNQEEKQQQQQQKSKLQTINQNSETNNINNNNQEDEESKEKNVEIYENTNLQKDINWEEQKLNQLKEKLAQLYQKLENQ